MKKKKLIFVTPEELHEELMQDEAFRELYENPSIRYQTGRNVAKARILKGYTQEELADLIGTSQPNIARIERGKIDSLAMFERISKALKTEAIAPTLGCLDSKLTVNNTAVESSYSDLALSTLDNSQEVPWLHSSSDYLTH
ncbi:MAG: helix-turn-helix transcriptional regulator [Patescibacteria group bacterium]